MNDCDIAIIYPAYMNYGAILTAHYLASQGLESWLIGLEWYWGGKTNKETLNKLEKCLKDLSPELIGTSNMYLPKNWQEKIKEELEVPIVASGYAIDVRMSEICRADEPIDLAVLGTPHYFPEFTKKLKKGGKIDEIVREYSNILLKQGREIKKPAKIEVKKACFLPTEISEIPHFWISKKGEKRKPAINCTPILHMYGCDYSKCSFCVESCREAPLITFSSDEYKKLLQLWNEVYPSRYGFILSENPGKEFDEIIRNSLSVAEFDYIIFFSRPSDFVRHNQKIEEGIKICKKNDIICVDQLMGFESFNDRDLGILRKPSTRETNIKAVFTLRRLKEKYPQNFEYQQPISDHGIITGLPWRNIHEVSEEFKTLKKYEMWDIFSPEGLSTTLHVHSYNKKMVNMLKTLKKERKIRIEYVDDYGIYQWTYTDPMINFIYEKLRKITKEYKIAKTTITQNYNKDKELWEKFFYKSQEISKQIIEILASNEFLNTWKK